MPQIILGTFNVPTTYEELQAVLALFVVLWASMGSGDGVPRSGCELPGAVQLGVIWRETLGADPKLSTSPLTEPLSVQATLLVYAVMSGSVCEQPWSLSALTRYGGLRQWFGPIFFLFPCLSVSSFTAAWVQFQRQGPPFEALRTDHFQHIERAGRDVYLPEVDWDKVRW